ncbi:MAG TPA: hypothetical protein EYP04_03120 [Anaerolineae bacterium]|nr:hypothetical protein [Anaerolineae bacterium]HIQ05042.1 hypothetical protein [Anaerolineae bacterium]
MSHFPLGHLEAYVDGELSGTERQRVKRHLRRCPVCREEVAALQSLSELLKGVHCPWHRFSSAEAFWARLESRLGRQILPGTLDVAVKRGLLWLLPAGVVLAQALLSAVGLVTLLLSASSSLGVVDASPLQADLLPSSVPWWMPDGLLPLQLGSDVSVLGQLLGRGSGSWVSFLLPTFVLFVGTLVLGALYLGWLLVWLPALRAERKVKSPASSIIFRPYAPGGGR